MYAPGKVMKSGTWSDPSFAGRTVTGRTAVIDMNQPSPVWRETAPMHHPRSFETITSLPDGTSIVTGGTSRSDGVDMSTAVLPAEIWNPETETWTEMAAQVNGRGYHSTALLLPDGRVLSAGGGQLPGYPVIDQRNAEIFSPPYLFKGPRPTVLSAPSTVQHGSSFTVGVVGPGEHHEGVDGAPGLRDAHLRPEPALHPAQLHEHRRVAQRAGAGELEHRASRLLHAVRRQRQRRAVDGRVRPHAGAQRGRDRSDRAGQPHRDRRPRQGRPDLDGVDRQRLHPPLQRPPQHDARVHADRRQPRRPADRHELHRQRARGRDLLLHGPGRGPGGEPEHALGRGERDRDRRLHRPDRLDHGARRRRDGPGVGHRDGERGGRRGRERRAVQARRRQPRQPRTPARPTPCPGTPPPRPTAPTA